MIRARKQFGQHFLEPVWVDKVIAAIGPARSEAFLEIGAGRGALTRPLSARARSVLAIEIDRDLSRDLQRESLPHVTIVQGNFLDLPVQEELTRLVAADPGPVRVAGNLPYNVASPILFALVDLFAAGAPFTDATVMLQREVADRLLASPGTRTYGALTVLIGHNASVERVLNLPAGAFRPAPKVLSSVVRLRFHRPAPSVRDVRLFRALVLAAFSRRRKTMANAVRALPAAGPLPGWLDATRRPETLTVGEFARLADDFSR